MKALNLLWMLTLSLTIQIGFSQKTDLFKAKEFQSETGSLKYRILLPEKSKVNRSFPLVIFLHGSGERGSDNELQLKHGSDFFLSSEARERFPAYVVFPQCPANDRWNSAIYNLDDENPDFIFPKRSKDNLQLSLVEELISELKSEYKIDEARIYLGGLSMGGIGAFEMVIRNPTLFAAVFPICGGADPKVARRLRKTPFWIFHGAEDDVVPPNSSIGIYEALEKKGANVKLSLYEGVGHDSWTKAFQEPDLLTWIFSKKRRLKK